jgi:predicted dehydrogenase
MPTDASENTVDWKRFVKNAKTPYDAKKFFWWRNYKEYGTGMAGDLFVHLLSGLHFIMDSKGPTSISSMGDLVHWKDGRNIPDVMTAILHYPTTPTHPSFQLMLRANFISGENDKMTTKYIGSEGVLEFGWNDFTIRHSKMPLAPGIGGWDALDTYPKQMQQELLEAYNRKYSEADKKVQNVKPIQYAAPAGYSDSRDHFINFFESVRTGKPTVEDVKFGFRAAAASLACNESYFQKKIIRWDPEKMRLVN